MTSKKKIDEILDNEIMSAQDAADYLGTSIANIYFWISEGELNCKPIGKHKMLYTAEIEKRKNAQ